MERNFGIKKKKGWKKKLFSFFFLRVEEINTHSTLGCGFDSVNNLDNSELCLFGNPWKTQTPNSINNLASRCFSSADKTTCSTWVVLIILLPVTGFVLGTPRDLCTTSLTNPMSNAF